MTQSICICVAGWHFTPDFYKRIHSVSDIDVFVISHKSAEQIPAKVKEHIMPSRLIVRPNIGYEWGCYQQFLETGLWKDYDFLVFMHDDIEILRDDYALAAINLLSDQIVLVGNGRNSPVVDLPSRSRQSYSHASWIPPVDFEHDTVRGSFFVMSRETVARMCRFEVMWDARHWDMEFGNWSLRASSAKLHHLFGYPCFAFLSEEYRVSEYLVEHERGQTGIQERNWLANKRMDWCIRLGRTYVASCQAAAGSWRAKLRRMLLGTIIRRIAARPE